MEFRVLSVYFEYGPYSEHDEDAYCQIEYGNYLCQYRVEKSILLKKADELYNGNYKAEENENPDFWAKIAQAAFHDTYGVFGEDEILEILNFTPDIKEASFLTQKLWENVLESESNMGFIEVDEKEYLEEESGKSWDVLEKELEEDIENFHLESVVEIGDDPLVTGYGDLQCRFKESKNRWGKRFLGTDSEVVRVCI